MTTNMNMIPYKNRAMQFAEANGIRDFSVKNNIMTYYKNGYKDATRKMPFSVKYEINLDNLSVKTTVLKRINSKGWEN